MLGLVHSLHDPHIRTHVLPSLLHHLRLLRLVVHGLIDETTDVRVVIQRSEELLRLLVVTDLRELVGDRIWSVCNLLASICCWTERWTYSGTAEARGWH
jgi:hypothetical protein